jgi:cyclic pyranopterin phosphate synthase
LTTNGALLAQYAVALQAAGLDRVTVSLDALDESIFQKMNDAEFSVGDVLKGLDAAHRSGLGPIKINMVVKADMNLDQVIPMARHFKDSPFILRFIEYMDVGASNGWRLDQVVPSARIIDMLCQDGSDLMLLPDQQHRAGETAARWRYADGSNEVGFISSVTTAFCHDCTRLRLSTDGKLFTCLFAAQGHDVRALLRSDATDQQLTASMAQVWRARNDRYSELRSQQTVTTGKIEMSYIGG